MIIAQEESQMNQQLADAEKGLTCMESNSVQIHNDVIHYTS